MAVVTYTNHFSVVLFINPGGSELIKDSEMNRIFAARRITFVATWVFTSFRLTHNPDLPWPGARPNFLKVRPQFTIRIRAGSPV